jgi:hypothetical protein
VSEPGGWFKEVLDSEVRYWERMVGDGGQCCCSAGATWR